jgi:adenine-specific DNA-methyltransferase
LRDHVDLEFEAVGSSLRIKTKIRDVDGMTVKDIIVGPSTTTGQKDLVELELDRAFETPKPVSLLEILIAATTSGDDLVLDFFAGSGATAQATLRANLADGGRRSFMLCQLAEACATWTEAHAQGFDNIAELSRERIRRSAAAMKSIGNSQDTGLRALKVDTSNLTDVLRTVVDTQQTQLDLLTDSIKPDRTGEDLLFQVLLDWGLELSVPIARESLDNREVFVVDGGALIACFAESVSTSVIQELASRRPLRAVFRDSGFPNDAARINAEQVFRQRAPDTDVKTI